jgi:hypothetical protein
MDAFFADRAGTKCGREVPWSKMRIDDRARCKHNHASKWIDAHLLTKNA